MSREQWMREYERLKNKAFHEYGYGTEARFTAAEAALDAHVATAWKAAPQPETREHEAYCDTHFGYGIVAGECTCRASAPEGDAEPRTSFFSRTDPQTHTAHLEVVAGRAEGESEERNPNRCTCGFSHIDPNCRFPHAAAAPSPGGEREP